MATASANASAPTTASERPTSFGGSTATTDTTIAWNNVTWNTSGWNTSSNLKSLIQELVDDNGGLASGAGIVLWVKTSTQLGGNYICTELNEHSGSNPAKLTIEYTPASCEFAYRKAITVQSGQVSSGPHTNFPMLVKVTDEDLATVANDGKVENASATEPYDLIFRALDSTTCGGSTSTCTLSHEIEKYNPSTGELIAWVKVPSINNGTVIYVYYGNSCITSSIQNVNDVWSNSYQGVWHMKEDPTGSPPQMTDSTSTDAHGTAYGSLTSGDHVDGQIGYALDFDASESDYLGIGDVMNSVSLPVTIEAWVFHRGTTTQSPLFASDNSATYYGFYFDIRSTDLIYVHYGDGGGNQTADRRSKISSSTVTRNAWRHVAAVIEGATTMTIYINGSGAGGSYSGTGGSMVHSSDPGRIGKWRDSSPLYFNGTIDELRVTSTNRSAGWIQTSFNNQNDPGDIGTAGFYSVGSEVSSPPTAIILSSFTAMAYESSGVLLIWRTGFEADNLGFNIYREEGGQIIQVNPELIKGSALLTGAETGTAGYSYTWWDTDSAQLSAISDQRPSASRIDDREQSSLEERHARGVTRGSAQEALRQQNSNAFASSQDRDPRETMGEKDVNRYTLLGKTNNESRITNNAAHRAGPRSAVSGQRSVVRYYLEDVDLSGHRTLHGPVTPVFSHMPAPKKAQSMLLSQINRQGVGGRVSGVGAGISRQRSAISVLRPQE